MVNRTDQSDAVRTDVATVQLGDLLASATRQWRTIALAALLVPILVVAAYLTVPRTYDATARMMIDPRGLQVIDKDVTPRARETEQSSTVLESELRIVTSDTVLRHVIQEHGLAADPELNGSERGPFAFVGGIADGMRSLLRRQLGVRDAGVPAELTTLRNLQRATKARREPLSFIVDVTVTTKSAEKSERIANLIVNQYIATRVANRTEESQRAAGSLHSRLAELRQRVEEAEEKVETFKRNRGIIGASGRLVNEQQLSELNTQLGTAKSETARATNRLEQIRRIEQSGAEVDSTLEALQSPAVIQLRSRYAAARQQVASLSSTLLASHPRLKQAQQELGDLRRQISEELRRLAGTAKLDLERARANEAGLEASLDELKTLASRTNESLIQVRELEREVEASRSVYASFLVRSRELSEQKGIDTFLATVISPALPARYPNGPGTAIVGLAALLAGLGLGVLAALWRDRKDPRLHSPEQMNSIVASGRVATIPRLPVEPDPGEPQLPAFMVTHPTSPAAVAVADLEAGLRSAGAASGLATILVTAAEPTQGKSTLALNLALAAMAQGDRVLLVDVDATNANLTVICDAEHGAGLTDVLAGDIALRNAVQIVSPSFPHWLPAGRRRTETKRTGERPAVHQMFLKTAAQSYDLVVLDGGILGRDRRLPAWLATVDRVVVVARCGKASKAALETAVAGLGPAIADRLQPVFFDAE